MRGLMILVVGMGVLIVAGVATIAVTILHRMSTAVVDMPLARQEAVLDEPAGTRIAGVASLGDRFAVSLQGGGPDRLVILDATGRRLGAVRLAR